LQFCLPVHQSARQYELIERIVLKVFGGKNR